ncbi:hypothetical protein [Acidithiobacillus thiooxidans]|jgi:hypothetical protein|uniref:Uncharacterized protein n=1 Tax=Acidithiobacillus thiooxidans ATCC 19377 TaxID=637390 RepID=A0A543Q3M3_ACITH|nr:hypothetical protein [Acidithiobacillus thiooxidans]MDX5934945.1 hypothetical protein [Acidithiobacillus thiooxidans]TQN50932.1 hypothetical protein DLNHIDIE_00793 [Acidithiobacillus thiooxidans ATCC 19377]
METSNRLTLDEISEPKPDQAKKPYYLTPDEIDALRAEMKASSAWMEQEFRRRYPNRTRTHKD